VLNTLNEELTLTMRLAGCRDVRAIKDQRLRSGAELGLGCWQSSSAVARLQSQRQ
jgi:hypothetical protein